MSLTDYHASYFAHELTKRSASDSVEKLAQVLADAPERVGLKDLLLYARYARVHPPVVAGRIRHDTGNWRKFSRLIAQYDIKSYFPDVFSTAGGK